MSVMKDTDLLGAQFILEYAIHSVMAAIMAPWLQIVMRVLPILTFQKVETLVYA